MDITRIVPKDEAARIIEEFKDPAWAALLRGDMIEAPTTNGRLFNGLAAKARAKGLALQRYPSNGHTFLWLEEKAEKEDAPA